MNSPLSMPAYGTYIYSDPLFQRTLVNVIRSSQDIFGPDLAAETSSHDGLSWQGLPVVFDEVFTGMYRLGSFASSSLLNVHPDISVHAKLLTGGLVPLCTTIASDSIYEAFLGDEKSDALLHGHSYTAHAVGCEVACTSVRWMLDMDRRGSWDLYRDDWAGRTSNSETSTSSALPERGPAGVKIWSVWGRNFVSQISQARQVESIVAVGTVLAISLKDDNAGYASTAANGLQKLLLDSQMERGVKVHSRVLGNVLYLMTSLTTEVQTVKLIEERLVESLFS